MLPIYVIERKLAQKPHYLSEAVLLAPAGFHTIGKGSNQGHLLGIACWSFPKLTDHVSIPDCLVGPTQKLWQDFTNIPATRDLINYFFALLMGGKWFGDGTVV